MAAWRDPRPGRRAGMEKLRAYGNVTALDGMTPEELRDQIKNYDALIIRSASQAGRLPLAATCIP